MPSWVMPSRVSFFESRHHFKMAKGLFDYVGELAFPGVNSKYSPDCEILRPKFVAGRALEAFIMERDHRVHLIVVDKKG